MGTGPRNAHPRVPLLGDSRSAPSIGGTGWWRERRYRFTHLNRLRMSAADPRPCGGLGRSKQGATNAMPRRKFFRRDSWEYGHESAAEEQPLTEPRKRRTATTVVYAALFFAGATFTAVAGDKVAQMNASEDATSAAAESTTTDTTTDATTTPAADATPARAEAAPDSTAAAAGRATAPADDAAPAATPARVTNDSSSLSSAPSTAAPSGASQGGGSSASGSAPQSAPGQKSGRAAHKKPKVILLPATKPMALPELEGPASAATIWLNRPLGDPTPPALRLSPKFARNLMAVSKASGVDWSLLLAVLRAKGLNGHNPA